MASLQSDDDLLTGIFRQVMERMEALGLPVSHHRDGPDSVDQAMVQLERLAAESKVKDAELFEGLRQRGWTFDNMSVERAVFHVIDHYRTRVAELEALQPRVCRPPTMTLVPWIDPSPSDGAA